MTATVHRIDGSIPDPTAEQDGNDITGRASLAAYGRGYRSDCCGVVADVPSHAPYCDRRHAARIRNHHDVAAARAALADYQQREEKNLLSSSSPDVRNDPNHWLGKLSRALEYVLDEIDREAIDGL